MHVHIRQLSFQIWIFHLLRRTFKPTEMFKNKSFIINLLFFIAGGREYDFVVFTNETPKESQKWRKRMLFYDSYQVHNMKDTIVVKRKLILVDLEDLS